MKSLKIIFAVIVAAGLTVLVWYLMQPDPQVVLRTAQKHLAAARSLQYDLVLDASGDLKAAGLAASGTTTPMLHAEIHADLDLTKPGATASDATFAITATGAGARKFEGETRGKDRSYYLRLAAAEGFDPGETQKLLGLWVKSGTPFLRRLLPAGTPSATDEPFTPEGASAMAAAFGNVDLFQVTGKLPSEKIDGQATYHYKVKLNQDAATALLLKEIEIKSGAPATQQDLIEAAAKIAIWGAPAGEAWIGKKDRQFHRLALATKLAPDFGAADARGILSFSRFGAPVNVETPAAVDFDALMTGLPNGRLPLSGERALAQAGAPAAASATASLGGSASGAGQEKDSDGDGLPDVQEYFYGSDPWNPDTDGDGWTDGYEVAHAMNPTGPGPLFGFGFGN